MNNNSKIKVCFVCLGAYPVFDPNINKVFGGAEVDVYNISTELAKDNNYEVSCIVYDYGQPNNQIIEGVNLIKSVKYRSAKIFWPSALYKAMSKAKADIYFRKMPTLVSYITAIYCKIKKVTYLYKSASIRDISGAYASTNPFRGLCYKWSLKNANQIILQNDEDINKLHSIYELDGIVIKNAHKIKPNSSMKKDSILWVGRSSKVKNPDLFLKLASAYPNEKFIMICQQTSSTSDYEKLKEKSRELPNLTFYERVEFKHINSFFESAKLFINTSNSEGFPNTFIQAAINKTPILSYNVNPDNFLNKYNSGMSSDGDLDLFLKNFNSINNSKTLSDMAENIFKYAKENHDIEKLIECYKEIFKQQ